MGRRAKSQRLKNIAHQNKLKEEDLNIYVDQLLRIGTQPHQNNVLQAMEIQKEIYAITDKIKALEIKTDKHRDYDDQEIINLDSQSVNNRTTAATIASFMNWVSENGAEVKGCEIKVIDGYEMGFVVNQDIPASSLVISVPRNVMLTVEMAMKSDLKELFDHDQILKNMPNVGLAIFLLYEKFKRDSFWRPYIDILPKEYNTIVYFTLEELEELKGSPTLETALKQIKSIARQYGYFYQLFHTSPDPVSRIMRKHFTYNEYCWAVSTVMTRQNTIPSEDGSHMINALIPLWDMCNHTNGTVSTDYNPELKRCECLSLKDFKPGEQFLIFYGARTNADLFIHNGFVYEDNFHDGYWLKLGISKSDRLQNMRVELLKKLSMSPNSEYFLFRGSKPIDEQTLAFLRVFNMNEGKTSIINRYTEGQFSCQYKITIGADFAIKTLEWDEDTRINLHVWDIAGHERFGSLTGVFYRHSVAAALVFDLTRPETFKSVDKWLTDLRRKAHLPGGRPIPVIILANKGDITVSTIPPQIEDYCKNNDILGWFITSAKENLNIDEAMIRLTNAAIQNHYGLQFPLVTEDIVNLKEDTKNAAVGKNKCC